jgi:hypothetical protein
MRTIRIFILFAAVYGSMLSGTASAQTEKGDWLVGGLLDLNTAKNSTTFNFSPNAGYFVVDNLVIGGNLVIAYDKLGDLKITTFGFGPFVRYYFTDEKVRPFFAGDMTFDKRKVESSAGRNTEDAFSWFLGGGAAFFINENVAVDGIIGYAHSKVSDEEGSGGLRFRVGFQVYINRSQVQSVRSSLSR